MHTKCLQSITCSELEDTVKRYDTSGRVVEMLQHKLMNAEVQYDKLILKYKKLDHQYERLMLEYDDEKEHFYYELRKMENFKRREEERSKSKYKLKGRYR